MDITPNFQDELAELQAGHAVSAANFTGADPYAPDYTAFRIGPQAFTAAIFTFLAAAIILASARIVLRLKAFRRLNVDDYFMIAAVIFFAASTGVSEYNRDLQYLQMSVDTGATLPDSTFLDKMLLYTKLNTAQYMLQWSCIYCVKFSYIFFFRPLTSRIRPLRIWWYVLIGIMVPTALVTICLSPWVCSHYDMSFVQACAENGLVIVHERVILKVSTATDIASDLLIISIPIWLLTSVKLEIKRKLALGVVLCLSVFMIVISVIRYTLVNIPLPNGGTIPDTIWLFFWQSIEACVAIIMVSLTAFRSLYGQERAKQRNNRREYEYVNDSSMRKRSAKNHLSGMGSSLGSKNQTDPAYDEDEQELKTIGKLPQARVSAQSSNHSLQQPGVAMGDPYRDRTNAEAFV